MGVPGFDELERGVLLPRDAEEFRELEPFVLDAAPRPLDAFEFCEGRLVDDPAGRFWI